MNFHGASELTFCSADSTGLELAAGKDGKAVSDSGNGHYAVESWTPCPPMPGCITVNVGDPLQFWSDGVLKSNFHRVRMPRPDESQVLAVVTKQAALCWLAGESCLGSFGFFIRK